jgi:SAM-dependent methyltransferase
MQDEIAPLEQELFCTNYELKLLAGQVTGRGLERWIPGFSPLEVEREHFQRYEFACKHTTNCNVLDIACGTGRGGRLIAEQGAASSVCGIDLEDAAIRYAKLRNCHPRVIFEVGNGLELTLKDEFDVVICFETIEHLHSPEVLLANLARGLKREGMLIISTPVASKPVDLKPANPHHLQEWNCPTFIALLRQNFKVRNMYLQYHVRPRQPIHRSVLVRLGLAQAPTRPPATLDPIWI